jgi:hypothetical protein
VFAFILFNPITYTYDPFTRVIREGIYIPLTLLVISSLIGIFLRRNSKKRPVFWAMLNGISLSAFWLTREEGIWIMPLYLVLIGYHIIEVVQMNRKPNIDIVKDFVIKISPFLILGSSILLISLMNYKYYGLFTYVEYKSDGFTSAYGALSRVEHENWRPDVPVPKSTRSKIYEVSPAFKELETHLEGDIGEAWRNNSNSDEIRGGWFMWALRDAVAAEGYYESAPKADEYYHRLSIEINEACTRQNLICPIGERKSLQPPWNNNYFDPLIETIYDSTVFVSNYTHFTPYTLKSIGSIESMIIFRDLTRENINPSPEEHLLPKQTILSNYKMEILNSIGMGYKYITPYLLTISFIIYLISLVKDILSRKIRGKDGIIDLNYIHLCSENIYNKSDSC